MKEKEEFRVECIREFRGSLSERDYKVGEIFRGIIENGKYFIEVSERESSSVPSFYQISNPKQSEIFRFYDPFLKNLENILE